MAHSDDKSSAQPKKSPAQADEPAAPEAAQRPTEEWVFTIHSETGEIVRVDRVDPASGQRKELSDEEYETLAACADPSAYGGGQGDAAATGEGFYGAAAQDPTEYEQSTYAWYEAGYHQGLAEYDAAVQHHAAMAAYGAGQSGYEAAYAPEIEAAYYQGMADYEALLAQQTYR